MENGCIQLYPVVYFNTIYLLFYYFKCFTSVENFTTYFKNTEFIWWDKKPKKGILSTGH